MTALLPPNLLRLFAPRPLPPYLKPLSRDERFRGPNKLTGVADLVKRLRDEAEEAEYKQGLEDPTVAPAATAYASAEINSVGEAIEVENNAGEDGEVKEATVVKVDVTSKKGKKRDPVAEAGVIGQEGVKMRRELRKKRQEEYKKTAEKDWDPNHDTKAEGDPYKTLFISRLSKKATEADLRHEFEMYGRIENISIIRDRKGKSRNYAFIVYERERDMKAAYKDAEGIPIHHKKILVDVERGRTVKGWKPRRLGGGLGGRPKPVDPAAQTAVFTPAPSFRGGFRGGSGGGFRGGFRGGSSGGGSGFRGGPPGGFRGGPPGGGGFRGGPPPSGGSGYGGRNGGQGIGYSGAPGGSAGGGGFGGPPGGGFGGPPGSVPSGLGQSSGGFPATSSNGFQSQGPPGGYGGGYKRDFEAPGGSGGGLHGGGAYDDRDSKRPRY